MHYLQVNKINITNITYVIGGVCFDINYNYSHTVYRNKPLNVIKAINMFVNMYLWARKVRRKF